MREAGTLAWALASPPERGSCQRPTATTPSGTMMWGGIGASAGALWRIARTDGARERVVHLVEYSRFPRRERGDARRIAYTQDRSDSGLGLDLPEPVSPGELLQVSLRDIDGLHSVDGLARGLVSRGVKAVGRGRLCFARRSSSR
ncbi:MAG: hypothetical protein R3E53_12365 [Myxococcota bacterium]